MLGKSFRVPFLSKFQGTLSTQILFSLSGERKRLFGWKKIFPKQITLEIKELRILINLIQQHFKREWRRDLIVFLSPCFYPQLFLQVLRKTSGILSSTHLLWLYRKNRSKVELKLMIKISIFENHLEVNRKRF